jgi:ferrous iron transport protein B
MSDQTSTPLADAPVGEPTVLVDSGPDAAFGLRLSQLGLRPGAQLTPMLRTPGGGLVVASGPLRLALDRGSTGQLGTTDTRPTARGALGSGLASPVSAPEAQVPISLATVPSCHEVAAEEAPPGAAVIALAGAPNVGKSTLFNALTGAKRTMGNWPGTTVEVGRGAWRPRDPGLRRSTPAPAGEPDGEAGQTAYELVDLPGAYSLDPASPDEALTRALILEVAPHERPELVIVAADSTHLARSLYLVASLREQPIRVVVALTMGDIAARRGLTVDAARLCDSLGVPVARVDPRRRTGLDDLAADVAAALRAPPPSPRPHDVHADGFDQADERFAWVDAVVGTAVSRAAETRRTWSDLIDRFALSRVGGPALFAAVMWAVFQLTTAVAAPLQDALASLFSGPVSDGARSALRVLHLDHPVVTGLLVDGLVAGVGMLLTFVPLMALMFALLALLEDSGYLARAAVVADRSMRAIGLPGRAFLPLIVGFGCNVPAVAATRVLSGARQRTLTALLVPFTSCSARLTVYVMLATTFFRGYAGTVVFAMYLASILLVLGVGLALRRTLWRTMGSEPLLLDLPPYQRPTWAVLSSVTWVRLQGFLRTAGGIIVATVCIVWLLQAVPVRGDAAFGQVRVADSAYAAVAGGIAPAFAPAGFGQWQTAGALVTGFVAKEAVISSWAQTYATLDESGHADEARLGRSIESDFVVSSEGHPQAAALAFMMFLLAYTPCVATLAAQRREIGWRWAAFGVGIQLTLAWALAVLVFQVGRLVG